MPSLEKSAFSLDSQWEKIISRFFPVSIIISDALRNSEDSVSPCP
jgi:hypothetical protein